jgi:hypothetical protein
MAVAQTYQNELSRIKDNVEKSYLSFRPNYERFSKFRKFVFESSLTNADREILQTRGIPDLEFNVLESFVSRLRGEFSKQEPSISVMADDGAEVDPQVINVVEAHIRHIINDANKEGCEYNVYTDTLSGGFSVLKVWTEYAHSMSHNQIIKVGRVFDPILCGFDPLARNPSKSDGRFCFELYPKSCEEFEKENPGVDLKGIQFSRSLEGFNWGYTNQREDILLICDYYERKKKRTKIVQVVNGKSMTEKDYKKFVEDWEAEGHIEQAPGIVGKPRWTDIETICRYRFIENKMIDYVETDFKYLPLVFVDGNSIYLRNSTNASVEQMTRPYVYHAMGIQRLKNFAGQSLANELENTVQHKFMITEEALPDGPWLNAYTNPQVQQVLVSKGFKDNDPNVPLPPPMPVPRVPAPPEIAQTFTLSDQMTQAILGSYDASLGINDNQLSGIAIVEGATQSNAAAMPYVVGNMQGWNQVAQILIDLIPKYYKTPRTIPVVGIDGKKTYQKINQDNGIDINYDENALQVKVEAGVNFAIQKSRALQQIIAMMQASPLFAQFMNQEGLEVLLDNIEIRGIDQLKQMAQQFMQKMQQMQQQQQQMAQQAQQNNPAMLKVQNERMKMEEDAKQHEIDTKIKLLELHQKEEQVKIEAAVMLDKAQAEKARAAADLGMRAADMSHKHAKEHRELNHKVDIDHKQLASKTSPLKE